MENLRWGVLVAALVAGPKLWSLVGAGDLDAGTALLRWTAVVAACTFGVAGLRRIVAGYEAQGVADREAAEAALLRSATDGEPVPLLEGTAIPATPPPPPVTRPLP